MTQIIIRVPEELKKGLQELADADRRKLSDYIRLWLEKIVNNEKIDKDGTD